MKKILAALFLFALLPILSNAQKAIKVDETNENLGGGSHNSIVVTIWEVDVKEVEKEWKSEVKHMGGHVSNKDEIFGDDCKLKSMGDNTFDIYSKVTKISDGEVKLAVAVDLGGAFMTSSQHASQFKAIRDHVYEFAIKTTKKAIHNQVKEAEKELSHREKDLEHLEKENKRLHSDIESWTKAIEQAKKDIETNVTDQGNKKTEIEEQEKIVDDVKSKEDAVK